MATRSVHPSHRIIAALVAMTVMITVIGQLAPRVTAGASALTASGVSSPWVAERLSVGPGGVEADGASSEPSFSADGGSVAFVTQATNLTTPGGSGQSVVVRSLADGTNEFVSVNEGGSTYPAPREPAVSADANEVVMSITSGGERALVLRDRAAGTSGNVGPGIGLNSPAISGDGDRIVFIQQDVNPWDSDNRDQAWLYDNRPLAPGEERAIVVSNLAGLNDEANRPAISADGNTMAYSARIGGVPGTHVRDITTRPIGEPTWYPWAHDPALSADGRFLVTFRHGSSGPIVHRLDRLTGEETVVAELPAGGDMLDVSADGTVVAYFVSYRDDADEIRNEIRVTNVATGKTEAVANVGDYPNLDLSADGRSVVFSTASDDMVDGDTNGVSDVFIARRTDSTGPTWPAGAALVADVVTSSTVSLSWRPAEDDTGLAGYVITQGGEQIADLPATATSHLVTGLLPETGYDFQITAVDLDGNASSAMSRSVLTEPTPTDPGTAPLIADVQGGSVQLSWDPAVGENGGYLILRADGPGGELYPVDLVSFEETSYRDHALEAESTYRYAIDVLRDGEPVRYTVDVEVTTPGIDIEWTSWTGIGRIGSDVTVTMAGTDGWYATAAVTYRTWFAEDGSELDEPRNATAYVDAGPDWGTPGRYRATFLISEGIAEVVSVNGILSDRASHSDEATATNPALAVAGALTVNVDAPANSLRGSSIQVSNVGQVPTNGGDTGEFGVVPPGTRVVRVVSSRGNTLAETTVDVRPGLRSTLTVAPGVPATANASVIDESGKAVPFAKVSFYDSEGTFVGSGTTDEWGVARLGRELVAGQELTAKVTPPTKRQLGPGQQAIDLVAGSNTVEVALPALAKGRVEGLVTLEDGTPAAGVRIVVDQQVDGRSWSFGATTDDEGHYAIEGLAGDARFTVSYVQENPTTFGPITLDEATQTFDMVLPKPVKYHISLDLYTKTVDDTDWQGPRDLDWADLSHYGVTAKAGKIGIRPQDEDFLMSAEPGDELTVCADGREAGLTSPCQTITLTEERSVDVELRMEAIASVSGRFVSGEWPSPLASNPWIDVYRLHDNGTAERIFQYPSKEKRFTVNIAEPGRYRIGFSGWGTYRTVEVEVAAGDKIDLGEFLPTSTPWANQSVITTNRRIVLAGETADVRVQLHPGQPGSVTNARARLTVPAGTEVVDGSVLLDGQPVTVTYENGSMFVPLPDRIFPMYTTVRDSYVVRYQLRLTDAQPGDELQTIASVLYSGDTFGSPVATLLIKVAAVTLTAPRQAVSHNIALSGSAPPGTTVRVNDGREVVGNAVAGPGGLWNLVAELPDRGNGAEHVLQATVDLNGEPMTSDHRSLVIDSRMPELEEVTLSREGSSVTFDPRQGVARFPMVNRGSEYKVSTKFSETGLVQNVTARIGVHSGSAVQTTDQVWEADVYTSVTGLGGIGVTYDAYPEPSTLQSEPLPTLEEVRRRMPTPLADFGEPVVENHPPSGETRSGSFTAPAPGIGEGATMSGTLSVTRGGNYQPTAADLLAARKTGTSMWGAAMEHSFTGDKLVITVSGHVPESMLDDPASGLHASMLSAGTAHAVYSTTFNFVQNVDNINTAEGTGDKYDRLNNLLNSVLRNCDADWTQVYGQQLQELNEQALATDGLKASLMLAGVLLAPETLGVGTLVVWGVTYALDKQADYNMNAALDRLAASIANDCKRDDDNTPPDERRDDDTLADPTWIHDPSGYVFEAVPSNRVPGVTTTLLYSEQADGPFDVWDAEWFGQSNPLVTDELGAYGWDVPEGFWQVVYTKDGYETGRSEVLEVLPPHFDVNEALVSYASPEVGDIAAVAGPESALDVSFTKYMQLDAAERISVSTIAGEAVPGSVEAADAESGPTGTFARTFRFVPDAPFADGVELVVGVDGSATSYAGVPLAKGHVGNVVASNPPPPEGPVCTITGTDGDDTLTGTPGDDVICGLDGNDVINGRGGNDTIIGGAGDDSLRGAAGDDRLEGGDGADVLRGDTGNDVILGGTGNDTVQGGAGDDDLHGDEGDDVVNGGTGNDRLEGDAGNDVVQAAAGDDIASGGAGDDAVHGGLGQDDLRGGDGVDLLRGGDHDDTLDGGAEVDRIDGGPGHDGWKDLDEANATRVEYRY